MSWAHFTAYQDLLVKRRAERRTAELKERYEQMKLGQGEQPA